MRWLIFLFAFAGLLLFSGCDERGGNIPELHFWATPDTLWNEGANLDNSTLRISLFGQLDLDTYKVYIDFNHDHGTIVNNGVDGDRQYVWVDSTGIKDVPFAISNNMFGTVMLTATLAIDADESESVEIWVWDVPSITVTPGIDYIPSDGTTITAITIQLTSFNGLHKNMEIDFSSTQSETDIMFSQLTTDTSGMCVNYVTAPSEAGEKSFIATLHDFLCVNETIILHYIP
ncbi:MAG: hypothetical protein K8S56_09555 [Candidatus Cloacimonetes bacterium]|nr:hypothetical protein [Candidatus Cloacimonadota bacterium]